MSSSRFNDVMEEFAEKFEEFMANHEDEAWELIQSSGSGSGNLDQARELAAMIMFYSVHFEAEGMDDDQRLEVEALAKPKLSKSDLLPADEVDSAFAIKRAEDFIDRLDKLEEALKNNTPNITVSDPTSSSNVSSYIESSAGAVMLASKGNSTAQISSVLTELNPSRKLTSDFVAVKTLSDAESSGLKSHEAVVTQKKIRLGNPGKTQDNWIRKYEKDATVANVEVISQELFRLMIENHPKTRINVDGRGGTHVNSKEVPGFKPLEKMKRDDLCKGLREGRFTGMGKIMVMALWLSESDFKLGNMGLDENNAVVKFDGDWCLPQLRGVSSREITISAEVLENLPETPNIEAYNWLDLVMGNKLYSPSPITDAVRESPQFRKEVNEALLEVSLFTENMLREFIDHYVHEDALSDRIYNVLSQRKDQLQQAALQNKDFVEFIKADQHVPIVKDFTARLSDFKLTGRTGFREPNKEGVIMDQQISLELAVSGLNSPAPTPTSRPTI